MKFEEFEEIVSEEAIMDDDVEKEKLQDEYQKKYEKEIKGSIDRSRKRGRL